MTSLLHQLTKSGTQTSIALRLILILLFFSITLPASGQGGPVRDASAIAVLQNSETAMGGLGSWQSIQDWTMTGTASVTGSGQPPSNFSWIGAGAEFRLEADTSNLQNIFLSGHGSPSWMSNGTVKSLNTFVSRATPPFYLPGVRLLQELGNQQLTIQYVGSATVHGTAAIQIHVSDDSDSQGSLVTPHEWFFDAASFLPLQVQFRLPPNEDPSSYINGIQDFWQFQMTNGVLVPSQISLARGSDSSKTFAVNSVTFNSGVPQSTFDAPQGGGQ
jgi:hypothetical protein